MKRKHVITTLALSMLLGVGVFAGITANGAREAKAADKSTLYCKMTYDWWKKDDAAIGVHYWGGDTSTNWPGVRGTKVTSDTDVWKFEVPSNSTGLIFTRISGTGAVSDWGAKTKDLTIPTDGKNLYTITSSSEAWGDPGVTGEWSAYVEPIPAVTYDVHVVVDGVDTGVQHIDEGNLPADPTMAYGQVFSGWFDDAACTKGHEVEAITSNTTVYGKVTNAEKVTFALDTSKVSTVFTGTLNLYAWDNNGKNADWPGVEIANVNAIELPSTVKAVISKGNVQTDDINTLKDGDTLRIKNEKTTWESKDYYAFEWMSDVDEPAEGNGYYIVGTETEWKYAGATKMQDISTYGNDAELMNYVGKVGEKLKVRYYNAEETKDVYGFCKSGELAGIGEVDGDENFVFTAAAAVDIFAKWEEVSEDNWQINFYIAAHADRYEVTIHDVLFEGAKKAGLAAETHTARATAGVPFEYNLPEMNGYVARGLFTDENCTIAYEPVALEAATNLYAKYTKIGNYIAGDATYAGSEATAWQIDGASYLTTVVNDPNNKLEGTVVIPASADAEHPVKVKALPFQGIDEEGKTIWGAETYTLGAEYKFVELDKDSNFSFTKGGTYAVYINKANEVYFNEGLAAFLTKYITDMNHVCDADGHTNLEALGAAWADLKVAYDSLGADEKATVVAVGIDGGNPEGDDLHKVVASYEYIVKKYGTNVCEDFIWNGSYTPNANYGTIGVTADDSVMTIVVIASISVISAAGLFFLIRRKRRLVK